MSESELDLLLTFINKVYLKHWYNHTLPIKGSKAVRENDPIRLSEKTIQMLWNKQNLLNEILFDTDGKPYKILKPGTWNREPGPDFKNALILKGKEKVWGDVEIHLQPENWNQHGHQFDPNYNDVALHVVWDNPSNIQSPPNIPLLQLSNQTSVGLDKIWEMNNDYSYSKSQIHPPEECAKEMNKFSDTKLQKTFRAAGLVRLQRKAEKFSYLNSKYGSDNALYIQIADALGYKANRTPFTNLCKNLLIDELQKEPNRIVRKALLWGESELLPDYTQEEIHPELIEECKELWKLWWPLRKNGDKRIDWSRASLRPVNSPERRLAAFVLLLEKCQFEFTPFINSAKTLLKQPKELRKHFEDFLSVEGKWENFCNHKTKLKKPMSLIGKSRQLDIIINIFVPALASTLNNENHKEELHLLYEFYLSLPKAQDNHVLDIARHKFFIPPSRFKQIIKKAIDQQGLIQLMQDFDLPQTPEHIKLFWDELGIDF
ncbi:MAG: DUF2851 family protein [Lentisphaeraceae bacterium]|nr:DUF2851 family protein [Lentisphaeraceae bacterium]